MQQIRGGAASEVLSVSIPSTSTTGGALKSPQLLAQNFHSLSFLSPPSHLTKRCPSFGIPRLGAGMYKCRPRSLTVRASGDSAGNTVPVSPLEFESPVGQLLAQILQTHPHLLPAAIDQQLENLQTDRDAQKEEAASSQDFLYKRIAEVKEKERRKALEEIIYSMIVHKFLDNDISMIPKISPTSDPTGRVDFCKNVRTISQEAFDELVKENIEDLGLDPTEALEDAIQTLTLQGVDLSGIVTCVPGEGSVMENPVIKCLERLKELGFDDDDLDEMVGLLDELVGLFTGVEGSGNVAIGVRNGGLELVCSICSNIPIVSEKVLVSALKTLALLIHDVQSTEMFRSSDGPKMVVGILKDGSESLEVVNAGFAVVAAAATGNEVVKELFIELKIDELILEVLNKQSKGISQGLYDSIRVLLTPDDNRVVASQVYGYARRFAKIGIAIALVESLRSGLTSPSLVSASVALKAVAVNDEICKSIAESGGIDIIFKCIDDSGEHGNKIVARACCSLLSKLAGSDSNKSAIVEKEGMNKLIQLAARFSDDPSVLQEVMSIFTVLCLRSPDNAARAMEAGAGDLAIQAMEKFSNVQQLQRSSCLMIRNLVARNPENRTLLLSHGIEKIIRRAKVNHETCKDAATDALRDLGLDNYNS